MEPSEILDPRFRAFVLPDNRVMRWTESAGVSLFRQPPDFENGHTRDREGRLISCCRRSRLFICASHTLYAIYTNQRGAQRP